MALMRAVRDDDRRPGDPHARPGRHRDSTAQVGTALRARSAATPVSRRRRTAAPPTRSPFRTLTASPMRRSAAPLASTRGLPRAQPRSAAIHSTSSDSALRAASRTSMSAFAPSPPTGMPVVAIHRAVRRGPPRGTRRRHGSCKAGSPARAASRARAPSRRPRSRSRTTPVPLREVRVAEREQRAVDVDREVQAAADVELADVEVAAVLARRDRAQPLAADGAAGTAPCRSGGSAAARQRGLARRRAGQQLCGRRDRDRAEERPAARIVTPAAIAARHPSAIFQRTRSGRGTGWREPEAGMTAVDPTAPQSSASSSTTRTSPGCAPRTATGPVSGWLAPRSTSRRRRRGARAAQLAVHAVAALRRELVAGIDRRDGHDPRVQPVVARRRDRPHDRGVAIHGEPVLVPSLVTTAPRPPRRAHSRLTIDACCRARAANHDADQAPLGPDGGHDLRRQAAVRPAHRVERRVVAGRRAVVLDDLLVPESIAWTTGCPVRTTVRSPMSVPTPGPRDSCTTGNVSPGTSSRRVQRSASRSAREGRRGCAACECQTYAHSRVYDGRVISLGSTSAARTPTSRSGPGRAIIHKLPSTTDDPARGTVQGTREICEIAGSHPSDIGLVLHGTTVATNALLEHDGGRTGMLTTEGFRDIIDIGRHRGRTLFADAGHAVRGALVERRHRRGGRADRSRRGEVVTPLDEDACVPRSASCQAAGVEAVAVCFLFAVLDPSHEQRAGELERRAPPGRLSRCDRGLAASRRVRAVHDDRRDAYSADDAPLRRPSRRAARGGRRRADLSCSARAAPRDRRRPTQAGLGALRSRRPACRRAARR